MIVIGVDVHKQSLTAVAVDEAGRVLERAHGRRQASRRCVLGGAARSRAAVGARGLPACDRRTRAELIAAGEELVRVPPKLTGMARRTGRERGKSDPIDALAVARVALREPDLPRPRPGEERYRELKLLVVYRDDLIDERRRAQQRLRWHLHQIDAAFVVPAGALDRAVWLERVGGWLTRRPRVVQVRLARDLVGRCRSLTRMIVELDHELETLSAQMAPGATRAPGLRRPDRGEAAGRDRPDRTLQHRRTTGPPRRRRTAPSKLRKEPTAPPRPRRQPATELRTAPDRDHTEPPAPAGACLPGAQTSRRKEPTRSAPLPETTARTNRLQHPQERAAIDIGATLAQPSNWCLTPRRQTPLRFSRTS